MLRNIFLVSLLIYAVCAAHWDISEVDSAEDQDEEISADGMPTQQSSSECIICKLIVKAVKTLLSHKPTVDEIKTKLKKGCNLLNQRKDPCKHFIEKYMNKLVDELMTDDAPNKVCSKILIC
ncbi:prosaposin isoform X6 [Carassius gibelio]|uniref:prosaposin isoform X5 n=1 Tax=Carassius gibelio TaxID=101364 RepID=UPI0022792232|nr:prosaposin isoform X5 [Carassius gibelio]XP_052435854.1 prosaposin isoform X6 [Carassius gibelio]